MARVCKWSVVIFLLTGLLLHREEAMMNALMDTPYQVFDLVMTVILSACLWGGFLNIIEHTGFMDYFGVVFKPLLRLIYLSGTCVCLCLIKYCSQPFGVRLISDFEWN